MVADQRGGPPSAHVGGCPITAEEQNMLEGPCQLGGLSSRPSTNITGIERYHQQPTWS